MSLPRSSGRRWRRLKASSSAFSRGKVHTCSCTSAISLCVASAQLLAVRRGNEELGGRASSSITDERQAFEVSELSRERHKLVVGDVQRADVPVLHNGSTLGRPHGTSGTVPWQHRAGVDLLEEGQRELGEAAA